MKSQILLWTLLLISFINLSVQRPTRSSLIPKYYCDSSDSNSTYNILVHNDYLGDYGPNGVDDSLIYYCCNGIARYCLSEEPDCFWKGNVCPQLYNNYTCHIWSGSDAYPILAYTYTTTKYKYYCNRSTYQLYYSTPSPTTRSAISDNENDHFVGLFIIFAICLSIPVCAVIFSIVCLIQWCMKKRNEWCMITCKQQKSVELPTQFNSNNPPGASNNNQNNMEEFQYKIVAPSASSDHDIDESIKKNNENNVTLTDEEEKEGFTSFEWIKYWFANNIDIHESDKIQYLALFIENGFENKVSVKQLNKQQLKEIGITKLGHINIILSAAKHI